MAIYMVSVPAFAQSGGSIGTDTAADGATVTPQAGRPADTVGQQAGQPSVAAEGDGTPDIVVTGIRASLNAAIDIKRNSAGVVDAISAEDIGKFPDTNLAESLQRITGVSITRANGEGSQVAVRGFSGGFNLVTVNGRQLPSTALNQSTGDAFARGTDRSFDFQNLASEGVSQLEVYKTGRANIPSGGIGAAINIVTRKPLDAREDGLSGSIGGKALYDASIEDAESDPGKITPELSGLINWKNPDETFGVTVFGSYQLRRSASVQSNPNYWNIVPLADFLTPGGTYITDSTVITNTPTTPYVQIPNDSRYQFSENRRERLNGQAVIQFKPTDTLQFTVDGLYARNKLRDERSEQTNWFQRPFDAVTFDDNEGMQSAVVLAESVLADKGYEQQSFATKTELYSFGGNVSWNFAPGFTLTLDGNHAKSTTDPDNANGSSATLFALGAPVRATHQLDFRNGFPKQSETINDCSTRGGNCNNALDLGDLGTQVARTITSTQEARINQFKADLAWDFSDDAKFRVGADYIDSQMRSTTVNTTQLLGDWGIADTGLVEQLAGDLVDTYCLTCKFDKYDPAAQGSSQVAFRGNAVDLLDLFSPYYLERGKAISPSPASDDTVNEKTWAVYGQFSWSGEIGGRRANLLLGARYEKTRVRSVGIQSVPTAIRWAADNDFFVDGTPGGEPVIVRADYDNLLPSVDFNIEVIDNLVARASFSRTLARANYGNLFASVGVQQPNRPTVLGAAAAPATRQNPGLLPLESDNFDVSVEWYYKPSSFISAGFFDKRVRNFVGTQVVNGNLFGLRDPSAGTPGSRSGTAADFLAENGYALSDINLFTYSALLTSNGGNQAAATQTFQANYGNDRPGELDSVFVQNTLNAIDIFADPNDPLFDFAITEPVNNREGKIYGFELAWTHFFGESGFGLSGSYTIVKGDVNVDPFADPTVNVFALTGLGDSANITAIYEKNGLSARVAYNWRDKYLAATNQGGNRNPLFTDAFGTLDANISYDISQNFAVSLEAVNLTSEPFRQYGRTETNLVYVQELKPRFYLGARYRF